MMEFIQTLLERAGEHPGWVLACVLLFAAVDAAVGVGMLLPGETGIVLAAVTLSDRAELIALAVGAAAVGAFIGDQAGFIIGRALGTKLDNSALVRRVGHEHWQRAQRYVSGKFWIIIAARLFPGVRTFVAAAAGAAGMPYLRFAVVCGIAAVLWAVLWVVGGATIGSALLDVIERYTVPSLLVVATAVVVVVAHRCFKRNRT